MIVEDKKNCQLQKCGCAEEDNIKRLTITANEIRQTTLDMIFNAGMGHTGGSFSEIEILTALFFSVMQNIDTANPRKPNRDRFILSKGHSSPGYYTTLAKRGFFPLDVLKSFDHLGSPLQAHPDMHKAVGVDISSGSLGQGLSCGIGMALSSSAQYIANPHKNFKTFVLIGDGECQEGQVWEAALYAGSKQIPGIIAIIDNNKVQLASTTDETLSLGNIKNKWMEFGWQTIIVNGHNMQELQPALAKARTMSDKAPVCVIANTIKGKGVSFMEGNYQWHGKAPNKEEYQRAVSELEAFAQKTLEKM